MNPIRKILVVDDDDEIREALTDILCFEGLEVQSAKDGKDALDQLHASGSSQWLVLLDLMMPVMDGKQFLDAKATDPALASVPVIVLTAGGDCREVRAVHAITQCLHKPVLLPDLLTAISAVPPAARTPCLAGPRPHA